MTVAIEIWKPVPDAPGYSVSNMGRVRSDLRSVPNNGGLQHVPERILKNSIAKHGYPVVNIKKGGKQRPWLVHRLVAEAFYGPCPAGHECAHRDGNPTNAAADNLRWASHSENEIDKVEHGRRTQAKLTPDAVRVIRSRAIPQKIIAAQYGVHKTTVSRASVGQTWGHV